MKPFIHFLRWVASRFKPSRHVRGKWKSEALQYPGKEGAMAFHFMFHHHGGGDKNTSMLRLWPRDFSMIWILPCLWRVKFILFLLDFPEVGVDDCPEEREKTVVPGMIHFLSWWDRSYNLKTMLGVITIRQVIWNFSSQDLKVTIKLWFGG